MGLCDCEFYVVVQDWIWFVLIVLLKSGIEIGQYIDKYGDGVKVVVFWVDDVCNVYEEVMKCGVKLYFEFVVEEDESGQVVCFGIYIYGEIVYIFVECKVYNGVFLFGYKEWNFSFKLVDVGLKYIDYMVGNVELGEMNIWVNFYVEVMGFI